VWRIGIARRGAHASDRHGDSAEESMA